MKNLSRNEKVSGSIPDIGSIYFKVLRHFLLFGSVCLCRVCAKEYDFRLYSSHSLLSMKPLERH